MRELRASGEPRPADPSSQIREIAVDLIRPNPHQPRRQINDKTIAELAESIKSTGLIQPITVREQSDGYELIAGERRWRATVAAGLSTIPAIVRAVDSADQAQMALIENIQREDLNPIDRANSYRLLMDQLGLTQAELAQRLGEDRSGIANYVRLLNLADPVREQIRAGTLSLGHAKLLAGVDDVLVQSDLAERVTKNDLSVRALEALIRASPATAPIDRSNVPSAHVKELETTLTSQIGMRINVRPVGKKGAGRLTIHYGSLDQFDELLQKLGATLPDT